MIYNQGLETLVLNRHLTNGANELIILGGFIGPSPVSKITQKPIKTKIIYGCKSQANLNHTYHEKYKDYSLNGHAEIFYKRAYNHSKVYCWLKDGVVQEILLGSANFSNNGLTNDLEEILTSVDESDFEAVYRYLKESLADSESCLSYDYVQNHGPKTSPKREATLDRGHLILSRQPPTARISFRDRKGELSQINSGPRYSQSINVGHVNVDDCTIGLKTALVQDIPQLFPNNGINPMIGTGYQNRSKKKSSAHKIEFLWDDGEVMEMSFEQKGKETALGCFYKALRSTGIEKNSNAKLGKYLRKRIGLASGAEFTDDNLKIYGRDHFDLTLMDPGIYFADFGVKELSKDQ